ncbi:MAG: hypothetical protein Fur0037_11210 [Planctomycetota bacterium]
MTILSPIVRFTVSSLLLSFALAGQESPQRPSPRAAIPVDAEAEQRGSRVLEITIEEAMRLCRMNNADLKTGEMVPREAAASLLGAEAVFQPEIYGDLSYSEGQTPARNVFQPSIETRTLSGTLGWRQRVVTGGLFDLAFRPVRLRESASFSLPGFSGDAFPDQYSSDWRLSYTQPLLRSAWADYNLANIRAAEFDLKRSEREFERQVQSTLLQVVDAYWNLAFTRENYLVVKAALDVAEEQLRITDERIRVRELAARDRIADLAEVARRQEDLIVADHAIRAAEDALRRLLFDNRESAAWLQNIRPSSPMEVTPKLSEPPWQDYVDQALAERPDLQALRSDIAAAEETWLMAQRDALPQLDLVGSYSSDGVRDYFRDALADSVDQQYPDWSLSLQFSIPVGNQAARAARDRAGLELERRRRQLYGALLEATKEIRDAARAVHQLAQSIAASAESVRLAVSNLETERVKLQVGSSTAFEVQRRNQELAEARSRHLRNQVDYRIAEARLMFARGILRAP